MSKIEWTDKTLNPLVGCTKQSEGCKNCYAIIQANIRKSNPNPKMQEKFAGTVKTENGKVNWTGKINFDLDTLIKPLFWRKPVRIFFNSLSDLFHPNVEEHWIDLSFAMMTLARKHTFQILTKNPERMQQYLSQDLRTLVDKWSDASYEFGLTRKGDDEDADAVPCDVFNIAYNNFPLQNVHLGVSVENQKAADDRIYELLNTPAALRFLSCEPLLEEIKLTRVSDILYWANSLERAVLGKHSRGQIDWVIVGGESGPRARVCHIEWIRSIVRECQAAGVPVFVKQLGAVVYADNDNGFDGDTKKSFPMGTNVEDWSKDPSRRYQGAPIRVYLKDRKGGDIEKFPADLQIREFPKYWKSINF